MSELLTNFYADIYKFKAEIYRIPEKIKASNNSVDFSCDLNHHQSIMIDLEGMIKTLSCDFFHLSKEIKENIVRPQQIRIAELKQELLEAKAERDKQALSKHLCLEMIIDILPWLDGHRKEDVQEFLNKQEDGNIAEHDAQVVEKALKAYVLNTGKVFYTGNPKKTMLFFAEYAKKLRNQEKES